MAVGKAENMDRTKAWLQLNLAVGLFGLSAILAAHMAVTPIMIVWGRAFFAFLALHALVTVQGSRPWSGRGRAEAGRLILAGGFLAFHWIAFFLGVRYGGVALATLGFASFPAFVIILNAFIGREKPRFDDLTVVALITIGLILVTPSLDWREASTAGLIWGIVSGLLYAVIILGNRFLLRGVGAVEACWWQYATISLLLLPVTVSDWPMVSLSDWAWLAAMGLACTALAFTLFIKALPHVRAGEAAVISALEPVYAIVMAWIILSQAPALKTITGGLIIIGAVVWSAVKAR